ncbi:MAG: hypothetical protein HC815_23705 [Richelia sp. RM1_1_1]|nr:hypothetical protein [Richelia sp. RM1_1_1]
MGNLKTVTDTIDGTQSGIEEFTIDDLNRVTRITQSGNGVTDKRVDMAYDAASQLKGVTRYGDLAGTQLVADSSYDVDVASLLKELKHFKGTDVLAAYGFDYDAGNRITSFTSPDGTSTYDYDLTSQLTGTDHSYQDDENYGYDVNGNRTNDGYDTGTDNRLIIDGKYNYSYDSEGNRTQRVEIATVQVNEYSWDYRNCLTQVVVKDTNGNVIKTAGYAYDVNNRRIAKEVDPDGDGVATAEVERFIYDGEHIALTFDGNGTQTHRYLHGPMIDQVLADENAQGEVLWALTDNQGTVRDVVEADGTVVNHITYNSFGEIKSETNADVNFRFGYTGREFDEETGQYYYRARYYDAGVGRFINEDPIGFAGGDANLYGYVLNDPINATDPSGLIPIKQLLGSDPTRYSGLPPWAKRQDSYDEQQRQWALQIVKKNAQHICDTAQYYNVTPDAIAGAIFWEAIENPYGFWTRGANPAGRLTRPSKSGPNDFGIPGKIHTNPGSDAEIVP